MQCRRTWVAVAVSLAVTGAVLAEAEKVVVTATRVATPLREIGSAITELDSGVLEKTQTRQVFDALRLVPGVSIARNGGPGQSASFYVRGAPSGFTRVMIDGIPVNDPSGIGTAYDFSTLPIDQVDRIEVLRGPQSTLYGSDAMSGVIQVLTRRGEGPPKMTIETEGGSHNTWVGSVGVSGSSTNVDYAATASSRQSDGMSAYDEDRGFTEDDGYEINTLSGRVGLHLGPDSVIDIIAMHSWGEVDYDGIDGFFQPVEEGRIEKQETFVRTEARTALAEGMWRPRIGVSYATQERKFLDSPGLPDQTYDSDTTLLDWQNDVLLGEIHTLTFGADWKEEAARTSDGLDRDVGLAGAYVQDAISLCNRWYTTLGLRMDDHEEFGQETTYRATTSYLIEESGTRLKASWGTGFKAPSLYELYATDAYTVGNPDLDPQTSEGWDAGVEQTVVKDLLMVGATYFDIRYDDLIMWTQSAYPAPGTYVNEASAKSRGIEAFAELHPAAGVLVRVDYTSLDNDDESGTSGFDFNRPNNQAGLMVDWQVTPELGLNLFSQYVDERKDYDGTAMEAYTLVNVAARYALTRQWTVFGRVENVTDEDYELVSGYGTPGLSAYGGVRAIF